LQGFAAAQGLHGLAAAHGLHGFAAAQGLHGLLAAHGLHGLLGLHGKQAATQLAGITPVFTPTYTAPAMPMPAATTMAVVLNSLFFI
jgi:hypothetical protein